MGWETSATTFECNCMKYRNTHDFFMSDEIISYNFCEEHSNKKLPCGKIIKYVADY